MTKLRLETSLRALRRAALRSTLGPLIGVLSIACGPTIGDSCSSSTECSVQGDRLCDTTQPGGYCTVSSCSPSSCADGSYCVEFFPDAARLSQTWCMSPCDSASDCRDGYRCASADTINEGLSERRVSNLDKSSGKFCAVSD